MNLKGKVALITGSARGIGKSIAVKLATLGADVVVSDINMELAEITANEIAGLGVRAIAVKANVAKAEEVESLFATTMEQMGHIDILVNNAGITRDGLLIRMKEEDWDAVISVNLKSVFLCTKEAVKLMLKQKSGRIISISSVAGVMGNPGQTNYSASKAGILGITKTVAREIATKGITVNAVAPGFIKTEMTDILSDKVKELIINTIPMKDFGLPEDIANAVAFLASDEARYMTGQCLSVDGGMAM